jgi:endonuclease YncB( thermonuclease family)
VKVQDARARRFVKKLVSGAAEILQGRDPTDEKTIDALVDAERICGIAHGRHGRGRAGGNATAKNSSLVIGHWSFGFDSSFGFRVSSLRSPDSKSILSAMGVSPVKWDAATAASRLRRRRRWHAAALILTGFILLSSLVDHLRAQNRSGDDWLRFDGHQVQFVGAIDGQNIAIRDEPSDDVTVVKVLGIKSFNAQWDGASAGRIASLLLGRKLTLHLQSTQTRDGAGRLLADVFVDDRQLLGAQLAGEGLVLADRRTGDAFRGEIARFESQARRKGIGLWKER